MIEHLEDRCLLSITVNTLVDELDGSIIDGDISFRDAIAAAPSGETIDFSVTGTISLSVGPSNSTKHLLIDKNLTINGPGADLLTIKAYDPDAGGTNDGDGSRVFLIESTSTVLNVTISGMTITGGDTGQNNSARGGGILNTENLT